MKLHLSQYGDLNNIIYYFHIQYLNSPLLESHLNLEDTIAYFTMQLNDYQ